MGSTGRRMARLTLDTLADLPLEARSCVFWELDPVRRARAEQAGEAAEEKEAWLSRVLLDWGSCGRVAYVDGEAVGFVLYAPPLFFPGAEAMPTAPVGEDAVLLATALVLPELRRRWDRPDAHAERGQGPDQARRLPRGRGLRRHPGPAQGPAGRPRLVRAARRLPAAGGLQDPAGPPPLPADATRAEVGGDLAQRGRARPRATARRRTPAARPAPAPHARSTRQH